MHRLCLARDMGRDLLVEDVECGRGIRPEQVEEWVRDARAGLVSGEHVLGIYKGAPVTGGGQITIVTTARIVFAQTGFPGFDFKREHRLADVVSVTANSLGRYGLVALEKADGKSVKVYVGDVIWGKRAEAAALAALVVRAREHPLRAASEANLPPVSSSNGPNRPTAAPPSPTPRIGPAAEKHQWGESVVVVGDPISTKATRAVLAHCGPGEQPWFLLSSSGAGLLAAFDDRVLLVKSGAITSWMAGSMGGGRAATFMLADITGIEYNAGLLNGVLEILTASYSGSANRDYWRGSTASRNADSNDPHTQSNALPLHRRNHEAALPHLNELRARISRTKSPTAPPFAAPVAQATTSLADQLADLAALREAQVLSDSEFTAAKAKLLNS